MTFDWNPAKARANAIKHDVAFELATEVWDDPFHMILPDRVENGEQRWHALGVVGPVTVLVVVHSYPEVRDDDRIRIISARRATRQERRRYERESS